MVSVQDFNRIDEENCSIVQQFTNLFYGGMDRKRETLGLFYVDESPSFVWNGNTCEGIDDILRFTTTIPETQHVVQSIDVQRIPDSHSGMDCCLITHVGGSVTVGGEVHAFTQTFTLSKEGGKHKIKSNRFRYCD
ncbi:unnamed protein product [Auanema sp. JU1783]|nr:unnamed protein product [Auanema sp. JU1783]